jgi:hypothetical protein
MLPFRDSLMLMALAIAQLNQLCDGDCESRTDVALSIRSSHYYVREHGWFPP